MRYEIINTPYERGFVIFDTVAGESTPKNNEREICRSVQRGDYSFISLKETEKAAAQMMKDIQANDAVNNKPEEKSGKPKSTGMGRYRNKRAK